MNNDGLPNARKPNLVVQDAGDELLVYDTLTAEAASLDRTSAFVWQNCNGKNTISDIAAALRRETNSSVNDEFIWLAIDQLSGHELLDDPIEPIPAVSGMSRRDVIRKVGLGAALALPVIATLVAPPAAYSASFCGSTCNGNGNCTGTVCTSCQGPVGSKTCV